MKKPDCRANTLMIGPDNGGDVGSLRTIGSAVGLLVGMGIAVWLGMVFRAQWPAIVVWGFVLGAFGLRIGSRSPLSIWQHKLLMQMLAALGAIGGVILGVYLVHGAPAKGDFGWPVVVCSAVLAGLGFVLPVWAISRFVPVGCPQCGGRSTARTRRPRSRNPRKGRARCTVPGWRIMLSGMRTDSTL